jgi:hypothetical protein
MRRLLPLVLVLAVVAGCGADEEDTPTDFPAVTVGGDGIARIAGKDRATAKRLCDAAAEEGWPAAWGEHPYVTFDLPGEPFSCVKPS